MVPDVLSIVLVAAADIRQPPVPLWALELLARSLLGAWLFYVGACVGSFLNVVVYRLPRGMNLVHPRSHCPQCGHAIRVRDNLPVFGWLLLGGRCRDCRSPISPRYYFVELMVGLVFLLVAVFEAFLPLGGVAMRGEFDRRVFTPHEALPFWFAYALHVGLATTLIGATLLESEGLRVPWKLFVPSMVGGLALPAIWPRIRPLPLAAGLPLPDWQAGLADGLAGLAIGAVLGLIAGAGWWLSSGRRGWPRFGPLWLLATLGVVLGWQRTVELAPAAFVIYGIGVAVTARTEVVFPLAAFVLALALPWLVGIDMRIMRLSDLRGSYDQLVTASAAVSVGLLSLLAGRLAGPQYFRLAAALPPTAVAPPTSSAVSENQS